MVDKTKCNFLIVDGKHAECVVEDKENCPFKHQFPHGEIRAACWTIMGGGRR